ncbi:MAG TPA: saccharopine dehydrogenase NADP-binding domain-containing protein [Candidatus Acidoferrales bacterium]|nr:saccharopine dehydrogenase NADP-binding domain-containing protein [Candidatus Acidoferrales bacterium]
MRIFVLGVGGTGSLLAELLARQGHTVWCGDRDVERARRFLGKKNPIEVVEANARNVWSIVRAARSCHLLANCAPATFNETVLRAALRLRAHYLDLNSRLTRNPFKPEQLAYHRRFLGKNRAAIINAGVAPGLTNLLARRGAELLDSVDSIHIRLYESTESRDPISTWSPDVAFDEATSRPRIYRDGHFAFGKKFGEREKFRFPQPIGEVPVYLAAQDEVCAIPTAVSLREVDAKIGGRDIEQLRRWHRRGRLSRSRGLVHKRFPRTPTPRQVARLIRRGILENARFAAAVLVQGVKDDQPILVRWDAAVPTLYQLRRSGMITTPISYATAHVAALFIKHFPRDEAGVLLPAQIPIDARRAIFNELRARDIRITLKMTRLKKVDRDDDY